MKPAAETLLNPAALLRPAGPKTLLLIRSSSRVSRGLLAKDQQGPDARDACATCVRTSTPAQSMREPSSVIDEGEQWWVRAVYQCPSCGCTWVRPWPRADIAPGDVQEALLEHPRPEVACRDATAEETPRSAANLAKAATEAGWTARVTFARGHDLDQYGRATRLVDSVAVRLNRLTADGVLRAVAVWQDGKFDSAWRWSTAEPQRAMKARELLAHVKAAG